MLYTLPIIFGSCPEHARRSAGTPTKNVPRTAKMLHVRSHCVGCDESLSRILKTKLLIEVKVSRGTNFDGRTVHFVFPDLPEHTTTRDTSG